MLREQVSVAFLSGITDPTDGQTRWVASKSIQILSQPMDRLQLVPKSNIAWDCRQSQVTKGSLAGVHGDEDQVLVDKSFWINLWRREENQDRQ